MTEEVCARPGCGHPLRSRKAFESVGHDAEGCLDEECSCPAYRTQAQQEAWEALATAIVLEFGVDFAEVTAYAFTPLGQAGADLLELYR